VRAYRRAGTLADEQRIKLFCARVGEYRAEVQRIAEIDVCRADLVHLRRTQREEARHSSRATRGMA